jgi:hypothetical protein
MFVERYISFSDVKLATLSVVVVFMSGGREHLRLVPQPIVVAGAHPSTRIAAGQFACRH